MAMNGNNKIATEKQKLIQEKCLTILTNMLKDDDNKYCVDCDAKGPRWASWNLGVFLCIRCAGIHRNLGVHISKVKSVNLDTWKPEQAVSLQQMGNSRARAVYEANLPDNFRRPQTDSALESFIRAKYEHNKYTAREWVAPRLPKVSWDAEIEASMKEHRSARKSGRGRVEGPAPLLRKPLPAPASVSKPPAAAAAAAQSRDKAKPTEPPPPAAAAAPPASAAADLLGLETPAPEGSSSDPFGDFLAAAPVSEAAPPAAAAAPAAANSSSGDPKLASDEANFFSQQAPAASSAAGSVLSRDSILALYGQAGGGGGVTAGGGGGMAGFPSLPAASGPVGGYAGMPATSTVGGFPSMPVASTVGGFPSQQQPASYPSAQGFSMGYPAAQQQQQFAGLQQQQQFPQQQQQQQQFPQQQQQQQFPQQIGAFQSSPYQQQQQQQPYMAGAAFGQSFPGAQPTSAAPQQGFPPQLHQQMAGLSMGHPQMAAPAAGFPPMGAAPPMGSTLGGQLWQ